MTPQEAAAHKTLSQRLQVIGDAEGGRRFLGKPDRWYEEPTWRCINDHVSKTYLGPSSNGRCLACGMPIRLTFPEDVEGPLKEPEAAA